MKLRQENAGKIWTHFWQKFQKNDNFDEMLSKKGYGVRLRRGQWEKGSMLQLIPVTNFKRVSSPPPPPPPSWSS